LWGDARFTERHFKAAATHRPRGGRPQQAAMVMAKPHPIVIGATAHASRCRKDIPMKAVLAAVLLAACSSVAAAAVFDLSTRTCRQFQQSGDDEIKIILAWLDGYYKDEKDPPIIDTDKFVANAKKRRILLRQS
jgi:acid stress chaperone HdeB